eukprot:CAMPEP_0202814334 /NCGR_PEP_ID=MMETSP1389-20130828/5490_1 /ASSEMBLY_ACC=CAM_ASM_000865 /TAXON_ID=302021 /ORGANISM="Rhodomonas sp., Strain CCMP768" /LENGTH=102 /DNA_ID=CAMNT_0049486091 /DNA_START=199 /DNA_END=504 /DNA_ORIENTATION=+
MRQAGWSLSNVMRCRRIPAGEPHHAQIQGFVRVAENASCSALEVDHVVFCDVLLAARQRRRAGPVARLVHQGEAGLALALTDVDHIRALLRQEFVVRVRLDH